MVSSRKKQQKQLKLLFLLIMFVAFSFMGYNYYKTYQFFHNPLSKSITNRIDSKEKEILSLMQKNFNESISFPIIITEKIKGRLYGLTSYSSGKIIIYLNKKVMLESLDYMIDSVLPHEYAHAYLFYKNDFSKEKDGHSQKWLETCKLLGGKDCRQYVNQHEVVMGKIEF